MKITKTASGKKTLRISKKEWKDIGNKYGWMKVAQYSDSGLPEDTGTSEKSELAGKIQNDLYMGILHDISNGALSHNALLELEGKLQVLSSWIVNQIEEKKNETNQNSFRQI